MQLIRPDGESAGLDRKVEEQIDVCIEHPHVRSVELHWLPVRDHPTPVKCENRNLHGQRISYRRCWGLTWAAIVPLVRVMRSSGHSLNFLGLRGTMLSDGEASLLADSDALNTLPARDPSA